MTTTKVSETLSTKKGVGTTLLTSFLAVAILAELMLGGFLESDSLAIRILRPLGTWSSLLALYFGAQQVFSRYQASDKKAHITLCLLLVAAVACTALTKLILIALFTYSGWYGAESSSISDISIAFMLPYVAVALVMQSIRGIQFGLYTAAMLALLFGMYAPNAPILVPLIVTSTVVACLVFRQGVRSRSTYLRGAAWIAASMLPFALISLVVEPAMGPLDVIVRLLGCVLSSGIAALIAIACTPLVEFFGEYASDMRLIEMATLDHPLLKELSVQAPGTWNHSMVIGMMVESAASAIGANPVICRVGAYFHDIGKSKKPLYFVENQNPGENRHDKLSPSMSALIIRAHVKDGIDLARRHRIPKIIEDMIPQHHGTSVIDYFYDKARKEAEESGIDPDTVDKALYQYPGPRPQTKEAGLLMLADGIEAAMRTLQEPNQDRIQGLVQKMVNKVFTSGELNECELTLRDLHQIARSFTRVLTGIYHQRIAYAEPAEKTNESAESKAKEQSKEQAKKPKEENLKRLGIE